MTLKINGATGGSVSLDAPDNTSPAGTDVTLTLPVNDGDAGQYLQTDGTGALSWQTVTELPDAIDVNASAPADSVNIDASGRLLVGPTTARSNVELYNTNRTPTLQVETATNTNNNGIALINNNGSGWEPMLTLATSGGGAVGSNTLVSSGTAVGSIAFSGNDGDQFVELARISGFVDGTPGANDMPGRLVFSTTADGASSPTERMRLTNDGYLRFGNGNSYYHTIRAAGGNNPFEFTANAGQQNAEAIGRFAFNTSSFGGAITTRAEIQNQGLFRVFTTAEQCARFSTTLSASTNTYLIDGRYSASGLGTGTLAFIIYTNGNIANVNNSYTGFSDVKLKENIVDATSQWDDIKAIKIRKYNFKEETGYPTHTQLGVVAQELELISPGLVIESPERKPTQIPVLDENGDAVLDENGDPTFNTEDRETGEVIKSVNYSVLYMKAVKALQEAMERIETLETANASLEARLTALEGGAA